MDSQHQPLDTLQDIKKMMERSTRFISLSGWSGITAGLCALGGAWAAGRRLSAFAGQHDLSSRVEPITAGSSSAALLADLLVIAGITFVAAVISAFAFTYARSRKQGVNLWDRTAMRLAWNTLFPMAVGGIFILKLMVVGQLPLVAPGCLIFYGLALINASRYTVGEIRYLGYCQVILGLINLWVDKEIHSGLYFWALGFGVLHIVYGSLMWWKYERG